MRLIEMQEPKRKLHRYLCLK